MKKAIVFGMALLSSVTMLAGCTNTDILNDSENLAGGPLSDQSDSQELSSQNALVPSIMIEGTLYFVSQ